MTTFNTQLRIALKPSFDNFTDRARKLMSMAAAEAQKLRASYVGTEHLLLAMLKEGSGVANAVLKNLGVTGVAVIKALGTSYAERHAHTKVNTKDHASRALRKVIEDARTEARELRHHFIGTEHLLLSLAKQPPTLDTMAVAILNSLSVTPERVRAEVLSLLGEGETPGQPRPPTESTAVQQLIDAAREYREKLMNDPAFAREVIAKWAKLGMVGQLKAANEAIAADYIAPFRVVTGSGGSGAASPDPFAGEGYAYPVEPGTAKTAPPSLAVNVGDGNPAPYVCPECGLTNCFPGKSDINEDDNPTATAKDKATKPSHALRFNKDLAEKAEAMNLWLDGTAEDGTLQGDAKKGPWHVFDIFAQTNVAGPYEKAIVARTILRRYVDGDSNQPKLLLDRTRRKIAEVLQRLKPGPGTADVLVYPSIDGSKIAFVPYSGNGRDRLRGQPMIIRADPADHFGVKLINNGLILALPHTRTWPQDAPKVEIDWTQG